MNGDRTATVVIGLGEVGRPLHDLLSEAHKPTIGVDQADNKITRDEVYRATPTND